MGPFWGFWWEAVSRRLRCWECELRSMLKTGKWELRGDGGDTGGTRLVLYEKDQKRKPHKHFSSRSDRSNQDTPPCFVNITQPLGDLSLRAAASLCFWHSGMLLEERSSGIQRSGRTSSFKANLLFYKSWQCTDLGKVGYNQQIRAVLSSVSPLTLLSSADSFIPFECGTV